MPEKAPSARDLLLEVGCEELPASAVALARERLAGLAAAALRDSRLPAADVTAFATPRRLVVVATGVPAAQEAETKKVIGPPRERAYDAAGALTTAARGFLKKWNLGEADARVEATERGDYLVAEVASPTRPAADVLAEVLPRVLGALGFPRTMRWPQAEIAFPRPVRWLACLLGGDVAPLSFAGLTAAGESQGHRVLAPGARDLKPAFDAAGRLDLARLKAFYEKELAVVLDVADRRARVVAALAPAGAGRGYFEKADVHIRWTLDLVLDTAEMPAVVAGAFDARYLALPAEVVEAALLGYLHLFPIKNKSGALESRFFAVHDGRREAAANVRAGLERVLAARLADASYFWEADRKTPLDGMAKALAGVVFAEGAGTLADKAARLVALCGALAGELGLAPGEKEHLARAAALCKADLVSQMVREKEFTHLQGTMGRLYARAQGEPEEVARAIEEHHRPAGADDPLPASKLGRILALADRLDTLAALFGAGHQPTGARDPFGLRRAAVGVCRLLLEDEPRYFGGLALEQLVALASRAGAAPHGTEAKVEAFILTRLEQIFLEEGFRDDMVAAVVFPAPEIALPLTSPRDQRLRLEALKKFHANRAEFAKLALAFKRPINILRQAREKGLDAGALAARDVSEKLLVEAEERALWREFERLKEGVAAALLKRRYDDALARLAELRPAVDKFFDTVMVMTDDEALRLNRLALMKRLADLFLLFADFTRLRGEEDYA